ncbi:hypothetical protein SUSAZ_07915 [Sulfolobus acidocaldarius SUSAZ]|nr:hypothetical protein SUSAZ_07915 [Sulfolobus acidocaldarius SUSAZ]
MLSTLGLTLSGLGLLMIGVDANQLLTVIGFIFYNLYWLSVPIFYHLLSEEEGSLAKVWSLSMVPAIIMPIIAGILIRWGEIVIFVLGGLLQLSSSVILIFASPRIHEDYTVDYDVGIPKNVIFVVLPLSIVLPFLYLDVRQSLIWLIYSSGQILGILISWFLWKSKNAIMLSLIIFSGIILSLLSPIGMLFYGSSEALVALGIEKSRPSLMKQAIKVAFTEAMVWTFGFTIGSLLYYISSFLPFVYSSLVSLILAIIIGLFSGLTFDDKISYNVLKNVAHLEIRRYLTLLEGIFPYFKIS